MWGKKTNKMQGYRWFIVNNQHPLLTINHLYRCILLVFFPHALLTMHGHRNIKPTLHVSGVTASIIRSTKTVTAASVTVHKTGRAISLQRGLIRPRWREVAVLILWPVPEDAVTVFSTPDDGCCDTRNMYSNFAVNKYLHSVAYGRIFINILV